MKGAPMNIEPCLACNGRQPKRANCPACLGDGRLPVFTVLVEHTAIDELGGKAIISVVVGQASGDAKSATDEACLWVIKDRQGQATPLFVIRGAHAVKACDNVIFDADDYDEMITCVGYRGHEDVSLFD